MSALIPMSSRANVLVVSHDEMLRRTRELILGGFFDVQSAGRTSEAKSIISKKHFDLIVLCHSLREEDCEQLALLSRGLVPRPIILAMTADGYAPIKPWADDQLGVDAGPYGFLRKCAKLLGFTLKSKARNARALMQA